MSTQRCECHSVSDAALALTLVSFLRRQAQFSQFLSANSSLTSSRYFRLMALACTEMMCTTPLAVFSIILNATAVSVLPWPGWEAVHYDFGRVGQVPAVLWRSNHLLVAGYTLTKWSSVICALLFFIFFGFASEARKQYSSAFSKLLRVCRLKKPTSPVNEKSGCVIRCSSRFLSNDHPTGFASSSSHYTRPQAVLLLVPPRHPRRTLLQMLI